MSSDYRRDLIECKLQSRSRGLYDSEIWTCELLVALPSSSTPKKFSSSSSTSSMFELDCGVCMLGRSVFDQREYDRCAYFTKDSQTREGRFMHYYSRYLSAEKKRLDSMAEALPPTPMNSNDKITSLFSEMRFEMNNRLINGQLTDGYLLYVYGMVLLKLDLIDEAIDAFAMSVRFEPLCWASWQQLAQTVDSKTQLDELELPTHWFKKFFLAAVYLELALNEPALNKDAIDIYTSLGEIFKGSSYIRSQLAEAKHNLKNFDQAIEHFDSIRESDPYRLNSWDIYSHCLFLKGSRSKLSSLAHYANNIDPFRVETCICVGNFYALRGQHQKAAQYFSRSLMLNPRHASSWILMGHEYMELKNIGGAIMSYRSAIECNKRNYRPWYGLGQAYDILKMPSYSLYYYYMARSLLPHDPTMIVAVGETLERLGRHMEAIKCYWKAGGTALTKLAQLYVAKEEDDKAAASYSDFIEAVEKDKNAASYSTEIANAHKFLAEYHFKRKDYKLAHHHAQICQNHVETRDTGKRIMKEISEPAKGGMDITFLALQ